MRLFLGRGEVYHNTQHMSWHLSHQLHALHHARSRTFQSPDGHVWPGQHSPSHHRNRSSHGTVLSCTSVLVNMSTCMWSACTYLLRSGCCFFRCFLRFSLSTFRSLLRTLSCAFRANIVVCALVVTTVPILCTMSVCMCAFRSSVHTIFFQIVAAVAAYSYHMLLANYPRAVRTYSANRRATVRRVSPNCATGTGHRTAQSCLAPPCS